MNLFEDIALFDEGQKQFKDFQLPGAHLQLWEQFFTKAESDRYFIILRDDTPWQQRVRKMYDKIVPDPRLTAFYGGANGNEWTADLLTIKATIEAESRTVETCLESAHVQIEPNGRRRVEVDECSTTNQYSENANCKHSLCGFLTPIFAFYNLGCFFFG